MQQVEMICLEDLVPKSHNYRKFAKIWSFSFVEKRLRKLEKDNPHKGHGLLRIFKCLLLQFNEAIHRFYSLLFCRRHIHIMGLLRTGIIF